MARAQVLTGISVHRAAFTDQLYLNAGCFADPGDQQAGNAPRYFSNIRPDCIHNFDVSFSKNITVVRENQLDLRADFFNFTNPPRFAFPACAYQDPSFGIVNSTAAGYTPRHTQFGVRCQF